MSNVIKNSSSVVSTDQLGVVGKIYEELFTDSNGNTMVRYLRAFQANTSVNAGELVGAIGSAVAGSDAMYLQGKCVPIATGGVRRRLLYGVSINAVAANSYGWCVCRGVVENVETASSVSEGDYLQSTSTAGAVDNIDTTAAGSSEQVVGYAVSSGSSTCTAYITLV